MRPESYAAGARERAAAPPPPPPAPEPARMGAVLGARGGRADEVVVERLARATPDFVRTHTGQVIGGVSPIGHPAPVPTWLDSWLQRHEVIWAAAGHPAAVFSTTYDELAGFTGAPTIDVA